MSPFAPIRSLGLTAAILTLLGASAAYAQTQEAVPAQPQMQSQPQARAPAPPSGYPCGDRTAIMTQLQDKFSEQPVSIGLDSQGRMIEVLAAPSGTWTILMTMPTGVSCLIGSGLNFEQMPLVAEAKEPVA
ncbi:MAG: hypothetical protein ACTS3R_06315 [Inquilinaceae bacterium]